MTHLADGDAARMLVGREHEQALLRDALAAALAGRGGLALIGGEAGIGKTALAEALCAEAAARGALVLVGRCYDLTETPPYGPWTELGARVSGVDDPPPLPAVLTRGGVAGAPASQAALFDEASDFFVALAARRPLVLLLDDLHWADPASLDLLRVLARQVDALPVLLLATYRADELTRRHPLYQLLPILVRETRATRVDPRRLDDADVRALVARAYPLPEGDLARLVAYLHERAEGNPFYVGELLRTLVEVGALRPAGGGWAVGDLARVPVPALLRQVIDGRLARLGEDARGPLAVAAVIGQEVALEVWQAASASAEDLLLEVIERAVEAHLLALTPDGARFTHALIREALYEGVVPLRRRAWHRRVVELLADRRAPDPDAVAYHFRQAGDARAGAWLIRAGERAQRAYAWLTAAERYEAALALMTGEPPDTRARAALLITLAQLRRYADRQQGITYLEEAARLADEAGDRTLAASALFDQGHLRCLSGNARRGLAEMLAALPILEALPVSERRRLPATMLQGVAPEEHYHLGALIIQLANVGRLAEAQSLGASMAVRGPGTTARGLLGLGYVHALLGQPEPAQRAFADARVAFRAADQQVEVHRTLEYEQENVAWPYYADRPAVWQPLAAEADRVVVLAGAAQPDLIPRELTLRFLILRGAWAEARQLAHQLRHSVGLGLLARYQGDLVAAWTAIRQKRVLPQGPATEPGDRFLRPTLQLQRLAADLALDAADLPVARAWIAAHDRWLAWSGAMLGQAEGQLLWSAYHRAAGDPALARRHAERALAHATEPRQPLAFLAAHRLLGELDTDAGRYADAATHLDAALALADACAAPYERALTLLAFAELRLATDDQGATRAALDETHAICAPLDAAPALARADALADRLETKAAPAYPAGLSAREVEVLRHVAEGLTNAQVAERLFLSPRTIDQHLRSIYNKLGVSSRSAATRFLIEHHLN